MPRVHYEKVFDPSKEQMAPIDRGFHEFNLAHLGEKIIYNYYKVMIVARDEDGSVIGGIHGEMYWDWLHIDTLWVDDKYRERGIGTGLLEQIEAAAISKGFLGSHLETTNFQAIDFYLKKGYEIFGKLEGKPAGSTWYFIQKKLVHP
jgi:GNAT superfamily N-acetyltransferase